MRARRYGWLGALALLLAAAPASGADVYLTLEEAPRAVFPEADSFEQQRIEVDDAFRQRVKKLVGRSKPSFWEPFYISFIARREGKLLGYAVVCEEIGKHRPITFIVAATPEWKVKDVAVMMYRESQGDEVRYRAFLEQFKKKDLEDPIRPYRDIRNITSATLSVHALSRGVRKALAVLQVAYGKGAQAQ